MATVDEILGKVSSLTEQGKLDWTAVGRGSFRTQIDKLFLSIARDGAQYTFTVYDDDGNLLESTSEMWLESAQAKLFEQARRAALKVEQNLEILSRRLDNLIRG